MDTSAVEDEAPPAGFVPVDEPAPTGFVPLDEPPPPGFVEDSGTSKAFDLATRESKPVAGIIGRAEEALGKFASLFDPRNQPVEANLDNSQGQLKGSIYDPDRPLITDNPITKGGQALKEAADEMPTNPRYDTDVSSKAADLVGNVVPYANPAGVPIMGFSAYQQGFDDAKAKGLDDDAANRAGLINAGVTSTAGKVLGPVKWIQDAGGALAKPTLGAVTKALVASTAKGMVRGGAEGAIMSAGHQVAIGDDVTSQQSIDDDLAAAGTNAIAGGVLSPVFRGAGILDSLRPTPEKPITLQTQQQEMVDGKRDAMLFTPGTTELPVPEGFDRLKTSAGIFHYNPDEIEPEEIKLAVDQGSIGDILDYGISSKPDLTQPHTAVVRRDAQGNEIESVVTDQYHLPQVLSKVGERTEPGQTVATESPEQVIQQRTTPPTDDDLLATMTAELPENRRIETKQKLAYGLNEDQRNQAMADEQTQRLQQQAQDAREAQEAQNAEAAKEAADQLQQKQSLEAEIKAQSLHTAPDDIVAEMAHKGDPDAQNELLTRTDGNEFDYQLALKAAGERQSQREQEAKMQEQLEQEGREFAGTSPAQGPELLDALRQVGGLPTFDTARQLNGELKSLREDAPQGLFRSKQIKSLDQIREALGEKGFQFDTPSDMVEAISNRLFTRRPVHGTLKVATEEQQQARPARAALPPQNELDKSGQWESPLPREEKLPGRVSAAVAADRSEVQTGDHGSAHAAASEDAASPPGYSKLPQRSTGVSVSLREQVGKTLQELGSKAEAIYSRAENAPGWTEAGVHGKIFINPDFFENGPFSGKKRDAWLKRVVQEEVIHDAQHQAEWHDFLNNRHTPGDTYAEASRKFWDQRDGYYKEIYNQIPREERASTIARYDDSIDPAKATSPHDLASRINLLVQEYARQLIQRKIAGETTEDVWLKSKQPALIRYLQALWERLKANFLPGNKESYFIQDYLKGIEGVLADATKAGQSAPAFKRTSETAKASTPHDWSKVPSERTSLEKLSDVAEQLRHVRADIRAGAGRTLGDKLQVKEARLTKLRTEILAEVQADLASGKYTPEDVRKADASAMKELPASVDRSDSDRAKTESSTDAIEETPEWLREKLGEKEEAPEPMHETSTPEDYESKIKAFEGDTLKGEAGFSKWLGHLTGWLKGFMRVPELAGLKSEKKAMFLEGLSRLRQATTWVQQQAAEKVGKVVEPLSAITDKEAFHKAYDLFRKKVAYSDLYFRSKIDAGGIGPDGMPRKVVLPYKMTQSDVAKRLIEIQKEIDSNPNKPAITEAIKRHYALVEDIRTDLEKRGMPMPEHLQNPFYFPHKILEFWDGNVAQVAKRIRGDFRGYLIDPVGSIKGIETDYVKAMYAHMAEVLAHNERADIVQRYWIDPYDKMDDAKTAFREELKANPSLNWEEWLQKNYPEYLTMVADPNLPLRWETVISPEAITETLGKDFTTTKDWQNRLQNMGIKITPEMVKEILTVSAGKERFLVPKQVKDAVQGILRRDQQAQDVGLLEKGVGPFLTLWKQTILNAPWNMVRYQYGNLIADTEKILTRDTLMAKYIPRAIAEIREYYKTNTPGSNDNLREALKRGVLQSVSISELQGGPGLLSWFKRTENVKDWGTLPELKQFEQFASNQQRFWKFVADKKLNPFWWSQDLSEIRESSFRYAKFLADLERINNGAEPQYAGALRSEVRALSDPFDKAAKIARDTFVDYNMISPNGDGLRRHLIPFYSWMEGNFRYHINLFRNMGDMASQGEFFRSMNAGLPLASGAVGLAARLALPWIAVQLWNNRDDDARKMEGELSDADRRKFHITLGRDPKTGEVKVIYTNTALADFVDWFSGQEAAGRLIDMMAGRSTFEQAIKDFHEVAAKNAVNKVVQGVGPALKIPLTAALGRSTFPDVFDSRAIPAYDLRHQVLSEFDGTVANVIEGIVNKDYYQPKDFAGWAEQALLQIRRRDPAQWAYFGVKQDVDQWMETKGLASDSGTDNRVDAQVKADFRQAIYKGDIPAAIQYYNRLLDLGYTSERFQAMVSHQDPLSDLPKAYRQEYVHSLSDYDRDQLLKAYEYTARLKEPNAEQQRALGHQLFPPEKASAAYAERFRDDPRHELLLENELDRRTSQSDDDLETVAQHLMATSLKPTHR